MKATSLGFLASPAALFPFCAARLVGIAPGSRLSALFARARLLL